MSKEYIKAQTPLPAYFPYPKFLLQMSLSHTARLTYVLLLDRMTLSQKMGCCTAAAAKLPRKRSFRMAKNCLGVTAIRLNAGAGRLQGKSKRKKNVQGCITRKCSS